jgi:hypothetical protein
MKLLRLFGYGFGFGMWGLLLVVQAAIYVGLVYTGLHALHVL